MRWRGRFVHSHTLTNRMRLETARERPGRRFVTSSPSLIMMAVFVAPATPATAGGAAAETGTTAERGNRARVASAWGGGEGRAARRRVEGRFGERCYRVPCAFKTNERASEFRTGAGGRGSGVRASWRGVVSGVGSSATGATTGRARCSFVPHERSSSLPNEEEQGRDEKRLRVS